MLDIIAIFVFVFMTSLPVLLLRRLKRRQKTGLMLIITTIGCMFTAAFIQDGFLLAAAVWMIAITITGLVATGVWLIASDDFR
ncbi:hypothetical protein [EBPR siphovirus 1]|nr:hypothetical protein [EBPR siphovirus 1]